MRVAVLGASGFIGREVVLALSRLGHTAVSVKAPRVEHYEATTQHSTRTDRADITATLARRFENVDAVVNAAGIADAAGSDFAVMLGANALLPALIADAAECVGTPRFVHISSASVQGRLSPLDETPVRQPFSLYSRSKALAEEALEGRAGVVVFRPTSVHGSGRRVTHRLVAAARTRCAAVAGDGSAPSPQCLVANVGNAVAHIATCLEMPPPIVVHPWEGLTTAGLIEALGGRPRRVPLRLARMAVASAYALERVSGHQPANARRLEMMLFGQPTASSWLTRRGWLPPLGRGEWSRLAMEVAPR